MKIARLLILSCISVFFGAASVFAADTCSKSWFSQCSSHKLCGLAVSWTNGKKAWTQSLKWKAHVTEAKRRGLTCGVTEATNQPDTVALDALRKQLNRANAELTKTKQKLAASKASEALLKAKLNTAMWDYNAVSTTKDIKHNSELATLAEQYETERTATLEKIEKLQTELSALETEASAIKADNDNLTTKLVESRLNASASCAYCPSRHHHAGVSSCSAALGPSASAGCVAWHSPSRPRR